MSRFFAILVSLMVPISALVAPLYPAWADESPFSVRDSGQPEEQAAPKLSTAKEYYARAGREDAVKDYASSIRDYTEAIRLDPKYGEAYGNRGCAKFNTQDFQGALSDYDTALKFFPNHKSLLSLKAQVEGVMRDNANQQAQNVTAQELARRRALLNQALLGGDLSDPATILMMNAQRRGLVPAQTLP
jgi:tetratricopeptide (TPR) repeat protein